MHKFFLGMVIACLISGLLTRETNESAYILTQTNLCVYAWILSLIFKK